MGKKLSRPRGSGARAHSTSRGCALLTPEAVTRAVVSLTHAIVLADRKGDILWTNDGVRHLFGSDPEACIGTSIERWMPRRLAEAHKGYMERFLSTGHGTVVGTAGRRVEAVREDGSKISVLLTVHVDEQGSEPVFVATLTDLGRHERETALAAQVARLETEKAAREEVLAYVTHEVRNALAPVRVAVENLVAEAEPAAMQFSFTGGRSVASASQHHSNMTTSTAAGGSATSSAVVDGGAATVMADVGTLQLLGRSTDAALEILNGILDIERLRRGKALLADWFSLAELFDHIYRSTTLLARQERIHVRLDCQDDLYMIDAFGAESKVGQCLTNFVSNAVKFTPPGGTITLYGDFVDSEPQGTLDPMREPTLGGPDTSTRRRRHNPSPSRRNTGSGSPSPHIREAGTSVRVAHEQSRRARVADPAAPAVAASGAVAAGVVTAGACPFSATAATTPSATGLDSTHAMGGPPSRSAGGSRQLPLPPPLGMRGLQGGRAGTAAGGEGKSSYAQAADVNICAAAKGGRSGMHTPRAGGSVGEASASGATELLASESELPGYTGGLLPAAFAAVAAPAPREQGTSSTTPSSAGLEISDGGPAHASWNLSNEFRPALRGAVNAPSASTTQREYTSRTPDVEGASMAMMLHESQAGSGGGGGGGGDMAEAVEADEGGGGACQIREEDSDVEEDTAGDGARPGRMPNAQEGQWLRLGVRDTGAGIDADHLARLFTVFEQLPNAKTRRGVGTGLGLAFVREVVERGHGGRVGVRSGGQGAGSDFFILLPLAHTRVSAEAEDQQAALELDSRAAASEGGSTAPGDDDVNAGASTSTAQERRAAPDGGPRGHPGALPAAPRTSPRAQTPHPARPAANGQASPVTSAAAAGPARVHMPGGAGTAVESPAALRFPRARGGQRATSVQRLSLAVRGGGGRGGGKSPLEPAPRRARAADDPPARPLRPALLSPVPTPGFATGRESGSRISRSTQVSEDLPFAPKVLVVDDAALVAKLLARRLAGWGAQTATAASGEEALRLLEAAKRAGEPFQCLVTDLSMPDAEVEGEELVERALASWPELAVIVSSGDDQAVVANAHATLIKPVAPTKLYHTIRRTVRRQRRAHQLP